MIAYDHQVTDFETRIDTAVSYTHLYYMNFIPYFANLFSPLFTFIAVIFFTSKLGMPPACSPSLFLIPHAHHSFQTEICLANGVLVA